MDEQGRVIEIVFEIPDEKSRIFRTLYDGIVLVLRGVKTDAGWIRQPLADGA